MSREVLIYLAGKIPKAHEEANETYWGDVEKRTLMEALAPMEAIFLDPAVRSDDLSDQKSVFGRDMTQVTSADIVFVDARERRGLGVGAEMIWAKVNNKAVVALAPIGSHYHKESTSLLGVDVEEWVHPFIYGLCDAVVDSLEDGAEWIKSVMTNSTFEIRDSEWIHETMRHYLKSQHLSDEPMRQMASEHPKVSARLNAISVNAE